MALRAILKDPAESADVRKTAARALGSIGFLPTETWEAILQALRETALEHEAAEAVGAAADSEEGLREALALLEGESRSMVVGEVVRGLCRTKGGLKAALPALIRLAREGPNKGYFGIVAHALGELGPEASEAIPVLRKALQDPKAPFLRIARVLLRIDPAGAPLVARSTLSMLNPNSFWEHDAMVVAAALGPQAAEAVPALLQRLEYHQKRPYALAAVRALAAIGKPAVPALAGALADDNVILRSLAAETLGRIGPAARDAIPALEKALADADDERENRALFRGP